MDEADGCTFARVGQIREQLYVQGTAQWERDRRSESVHGGRKGKENLFSGRAIDCESFTHSFPNPCLCLGTIAPRERGAKVLSPHK